MSSEGLAVQYPWAYLFLLLIPVFLRGARRLEMRTAFAAVFFVPKSLEPGPLRKHARTVLAALVLVACVCAVANVQYSTTWQRTYLESKWIMIVQDLSGSMNRPSGEGRLTLGDVALEGAYAFADLRGPDDLIGVVAFSSYAKLVCPPTFDREILKRRLGMLSKESNSRLFRQLAVGGATNASYAAWVALCSFFMLLPEEYQLSYEELNDLRFSLLGQAAREPPVPQKLRRAQFGHGMAIVLFTDGRIEPNKSDEDVRKGIPNIVNVLKLVRGLGVKLYLISVTGEVNREVEAAFEESGGRSGVGRIFYMPGRLDRDTIRSVYQKIDEMEKNKLLTRLYRKKKDTREICEWMALAFLGLYGFLEVSPRFQRI